MLTMAQRMCRNCKYWNEPAKPRDTVFGECAASSNGPDTGVTAYAIDKATGLHATLRTVPSHYCEMWIRK